MIYAEFRVGSVLDRGFKVYFGNFISFTAIMTVAFVPLLIYMGVLTSDGFSLEDFEGGYQIIQQVAQFVLQTIATALLMFGTFQKLRGRRGSIGATIAVGFRRMFHALGTALLALIVALLPLAVLAFIAALVQQGEEAPIALAVIIGIVPTAIIYCMLWVAVPVAVVERTGVIGALRRAAFLTKGHRWGIFGLLLLLGLIGGGFGIIIGMGTAAMKDPMITMWATVVANIVASALGATVTAVGYHDLRLVKDGISVEELESVFD